MSIYAQVRVADVTVIALDRKGGYSIDPFDSLNVADYVGDDSVCVERNIAEVAAHCGATQIAVMNAEHGSQVAVALHGGKCEPADVIVTQVRGLALLALAADCVPVALVDSVASVVSVVHIGWKGLLVDVVEAALTAIVDNGADLTQTVAVIGPSICGGCYEVSPELAQRITSVHPAAAVDESHVDLAQAVYAQLEKHGVQIERIPGCTFESEELFSFRRAHGQPTGRGGLAVMLPTAGANRG
jgi:YfiH family protein